MSSSEHQSPIDFPGNRRLHIALAVRDIEKSETFYRAMLGVEATKRRSDYAKFEPDDPSVNLTLNQVKGVIPVPHPASHFGIQVKSSSSLKQVQERWKAAGIIHRVEKGTECCYAVQDKVWTRDPDGHSWELFVVLDSDSPSQTRNPSDAECCTETNDPDQESATACC